MTLPLIALIIALIALGIGLSLLAESRKASRELDGIIADLKRDPAEPVEASTSIGEVTAVFDHDRKTLFVDGNIEASGHISAGSIKTK